MWFLILSVFAVVVGVWAFGMCRAASMDTKNLPSDFHEPELHVVIFSAQEDGKTEQVPGQLRQDALEIHPFRT